VTALRAGIYTRVSKDESGRGRSPQEQETEGRTECARRGWSVVDVFTDNDRGASRYSKGGPRADFERLRACVTAHQLDVIVVWEATRLQRDLAVYVELRELCRAHGVLWSYNGRLFDLDDADDSFNTGLDALLGEREVDVTRKRVQRALRANAVAGRPHGAVLLGYRRIYDDRTGAFVCQVPDPVWGPLVGQMFAQVAQGASLRAVARWLNQGGHSLPRTAGAWTGPRVAGQIRDQVGYLGHRTHLGQVIVKDAWPPLVDEITYNRVQAILAAPGRLTHHGDGAGAMLTGLLRCAVCGGRIDMTQVGRKGHLLHVYRCPAGHLARGRQRLEARIGQLVVHWKGWPQVRPCDDTSPLRLVELATNLTAVRQQLADVETALGDRTMPAALGARVATGLERQIAELEQQINDGTTPAPDLAAELGTEDIPARWPSMTSSQRRRVVALLLHDMQLHPVGRGVRHTYGLTYSWIGSDTVHTL
jgi:site-specific DNA recombinase